MAFDPSKAKPWRLDGKDNFGAGWVHVVEDDGGLVAGFEEKEDAEKAVLAIAALGVMMRRGWGVMARECNRGWRVLRQDGAWLWHEKHGDYFVGNDPFTALVEADAWYVANVEKPN